MPVLVLFYYNLHICKDLDHACLNLVVHVTKSLQLDEALAC